MSHPEGKKTMACASCCRGADTTHSASCCLHDRRVQPCCRGVTAACQEDTTCHDNVVAGHDCTCCHEVFHDSPPPSEDCTKPVINPQQPDILLQGASLSSIPPCSHSFQYNTQNRDANLLHPEHFCNSSHKPLCRSSSLLTKPSTNRCTSNNLNFLARRVNTCENDLSRFRPKCSRQQSCPSAPPSQRHSMDCSGFNRIPSAFNRIPSYDGSEFASRRSPPLSALSGNNMQVNFQSEFKKSNGRCFVTNNINGGGTMTLNDQRSKVPANKIQFKLHTDLKADNVENDFLTNGSSGGSVTYMGNNPLRIEHGVSSTFSPAPDAENVTFNYLNDFTSNQSKGGTRASVTNNEAFVFGRSNPTIKKNPNNDSFRPVFPEDNVKVNVESEVKTESNVVKNRTNGGNIVSELKNPTEPPHQIDLSAFCRDGSWNFQSKTLLNNSCSEASPSVHLETTSSDEPASGSNSPVEVNNFVINRDNLNTMSFVPSVSSTVTTEVRVSSTDSSSSTSPLLLRKQSRFSISDLNANSLHIDINLHSTITTSRPQPTNGPSDEAVLKRAHEEVDVCGWYYRGMTQSEGNNKLQNSPEGTFLLRDSSKRDVCYCLSIQTSEGPCSIRIYFDKRSFRFQLHGYDRNKMGRSSVIALVEKYFGKVGNDRLWVHDGENGRFISLTEPLRKNVQSLKHLGRLSYNLKKYEYPVAPTSIQSFVDWYPYSI